MFTLNDRRYLTDPETLALLRQLMPAARQSGDSSAVIAVMVLGLSTGRIVEVAP